MFQSSFAMTSMQSFEFIFENNYKYLYGVGCREFVEGFYFFPFFQWSISTELVAKKEFEQISILQHEDKTSSVDGNEVAVFS